MNELNPTLDFAKTKCSRGVSHVWTRSFPAQSASADDVVVIGCSMLRWLLLVALVAAKRSPTQHQDSAVIEEVNAKQLDRVLQDKGYVAVFWCK